MKDLSKLGRDLKRVIIIDNVKENFTLHCENGIFSKTWVNDYEDNFLKEIIPLLRNIALEKVHDVRVSLRIYRDSVIRYI
jgi:CTD small phosphatase-like protein 2